MSLSAKLTIGTNIQYDGEVWRVVAFDSGAITLCSQRGQTALVELRMLIDATDFKIINLTESSNDTQVTTFPDSVPKAAIRDAQKLLEHINEAECGYRSGNPNTAQPDEPRMAYDTEYTTLNSRIEAKSNETGISVRTLWELKKAYKENGIYGLVDKRKIKPLAPLPDIRIINSIHNVQASLINKSTISKSEFTRRVEKDLGLQNPNEQINLPPRATFDRLLDRVTKGASTFSSAKRRRNIDNQPKDTYKKFSATRPGEAVLIDSTPLDAFALDPVTFHWIQIVLTIALDLFSRSIVAWRFTPVSTKDADAALLLYDIIRPKLMQPGWPQISHWPYVGVPEHIVIKLCPDTSESGIAGVPILHPETVVVDHGKVFISQAFRDACARLGINIQLARPLTATDKSHVERVFKTIREDFVEVLPGYKGPDLYSRGLNIEEDAFYFLDEIDAKFAEWVITYYQRHDHDGLALPGVPHLQISPNDMYDEGIARAGFVHVVTDQSMYYELLPSAWRTVQHYGVELNGLRYDGDILNAFRNQRSDYGGVHAGKWPIRFDPRDMSRAFFYDTDFQTWNTLAWSHDAGEDRPFNEATLHYAKALIYSRKGNPSNVEELAATLNSLLDRIHAPTEESQKERRLAAVNVIHGMLAKSDRPKSHSPFTIPDEEAVLTSEIPPRHRPKNDGDLDRETQQKDSPLRTIDEAIEDDEDNLDL
jgi:transposase InsO family protein